MSTGKFTTLDYVIVEWQVPFVDSPAFEAVEFKVSFDNFSSVTICEQRLAWD